MPIEIDSNLFPVPESAFNNSGFFEPWVPLSIFALNLELTQAKGNILHEESSKGHFFFRNDRVPRPRPCTYLAWQRICKLGNLDSTQFLIPFLPSITADDEVGSAINERGIRIHSLSRRSKYHVRDSEDRIKWGSVYLGALSPVATRESILTAELNRSNITESLVVSPANSNAGSAQLGIRDRFEFLASWGFVGLGPSMVDMRLPTVRRLLLQFLTQIHAADWALAYNESHWLLKNDPDVVNSDYKEMIHGMIEHKRQKNVAESEELNAEKGKGNNISPKDRFEGLNRVDF